MIPQYCAPTDWFHREQRQQLFNDNICFIRIPGLEKITILDYISLVMNNFFININNLMIYKTVLLQNHRTK